jgi:hypothetical protein
MAVREMEERHRHAQREPVAAQWQAVEKQSANAIPTGIARESIARAIDSRERAQAALAPFD